MFLSDETPVVVLGLVMVRVMVRVRIQSSLLGVTTWCQVRKSHAPELEQSNSCYSSTDTTVSVRQRACMVDTFPPTRLACMTLGLGLLGGSRCSMGNGRGTLLTSILTRALALPTPYLSTACARYFVSRALVMGVLAVMCVVAPATRMDSALLLPNFVARLARWRTCWRMDGRLVTDDNQVGGLRGLGFHERSCVVGVNSIACTVVRLCVRRDVVVYDVDGLVCIVRLLEGVVV